jgi:hypothetical protein
MNIVAQPALRTPTDARVEAAGCDRRLNESCNFDSPAFRQGGVARQVARQTAAAPLIRHARPDAAELDPGRRSPELSA